jgi:hypothetical protein
VWEQKGYLREICEGILSSFQDRHVFNFFYWVLLPFLFLPETKQTRRSVFLFQILSFLHSVHFQWKKYLSWVRRWSLRGYIFAIYRMV